MICLLRYFLEDAESNSRNYLESQKISVSEQVQKLATEARSLIEQTPNSKM